MKGPELDVIVVGAGAAGLAAFEELRRGGCKVLCVEAKGRIGGRIFTVHDPLSTIPIELGAEFIHGRPPEIWDILNSHGLAAYDCAEKAIHIEDGKVQKDGDAWQLIGRVMDDMQKSAAKGKDRSFASFLEQSSHSENAKRLAASYVEGFNAARKEIIGIASLAEDAAAADKIDGDRSFRMKNGYDSLAIHLLNARDELRMNCVVERVDWQTGAATIHARSRLTGHVANTSKPARRDYSSAWSSTGGARGRRYPIRSGTRQSTHSGTRAGIRPRDACRLALSGSVLGEEARHFRGWLSTLAGAILSHLVDASAGPCADHHGLECRAACGRSS